MVTEYNVDRIVTLCHKIGNDWHSDAVQYFPESPGDTLIFGKLKV
jgi:hypothetical protein